MEAASARAVIPAMRITAIAARLLRQRNRLDVERADGSRRKSRTGSQLASQDHRIRIIQLSQLLDVLDAGELFIRDAGYVGDGRRIDRLVAFQVVRFELQQAQGAVRNQDIV